MLQFYSKLHVIFFFFSAIEVRWWLIIEMTCTECEFFARVYNLIIPIHDQLFPPPVVCSVSDGAKSPQRITVHKVRCPPWQLINSSLLITSILQKPNICQYFFKEKKKHTQITFPVLSYTQSKLKCSFWFSILLSHYNFSKALRQSLPPPVLARGMWTWPFILNNHEYILLLMAKEKSSTIVTKIMFSVYYQNMMLENDSHICCE